MCAHGGGGGGTSAPLFRWFNRLMKANVLRTTLLVIGSHVMHLLTNEMSVRAFWGPIKFRSVCKDQEV